MAHELDLNGRADAPSREDSVHPGTLQILGLAAALKAHRVEIERNGGLRPSP